jgi:hypothetical protein
MATAPHKPHRTRGDEDEPAEPGMLPVEPDEGPVPPVIPADPEHDRVVDPQARSCRSRGSSSGR